MSVSAFRIRSRHALSAWRACLGLFVGSLSVAVAHAQQSVESSNSPLRCLSKPSIDALEKAAAPGGGDAASVVRLRLSFESPVTPPRVDILFDSAGDSRRQAVLDYVSAYRLPCMIPGSAAVVGQQEFSFRPFRKSDVREGYERLERLYACIAGADHMPDYPYSAVNKTRSGVVFATASFASPNEPPSIRILYDGDEPRFGSVVAEYLRGLRITCADAGEFPITVSRTFMFSVEGDSQMVLKDLPLPRFLAVLDQPERTHPRFDFASMACPFDVRFELRQPFLANEVSEIGLRDPNRREFLEWLKSATFKIPEAKVKPLIGHAMKITVPCVVLDLR